MQLQPSMEKNQHNNLADAHASQSYTFPNQHSNWEIVVYASHMLQDKMQDCIWKDMKKFNSYLYFSKPLPLSIS